MYESIASRARAGEDYLAFSKRSFCAWMQMDEIAVSKPTLNSLWYRIAGSPFVTKYDEVHNVITVDLRRLDEARGIHTHIHTHTEDVCIHPTGDRYLIIDDDEEVRE